MTSDSVAHAFATILVVLTFLSALIGSIIMLYGVTVGSLASTGIEKSSTGAKLMAGGLTILTLISTVVWGWLSYKLVECKFNCE